MEKPFDVHANFDQVEEGVTPILHVLHILKLGHVES